jgi:hypothetical protein
LYTLSIVLDMKLKTQDVVIIMAYLAPGKADRGRASTADSFLDARPIPGPLFASSCSRVTVPSAPQQVPLCPHRH